MEEKDRHANKIVNIITSLYGKLQNPDNEYTENILKQFNYISDEAMRSFFKNNDFVRAIMIGLMRLNRKVCRDRKSLTHRRLVLGSIYYLNDNNTEGDFYINLVEKTLQDTKDFPDIAAALEKIPKRSERKYFRRRCSYITFLRFV